MYIRSNTVFAILEVAGSLVCLSAAGRSDLGAEFASLAEQYGLEVDKIKTMVPVAEIEANLKNRKAVKVIVDSAVAVAPKAE